MNVLEEQADNATARDLHWKPLSSLQKHPTPCFRHPGMESQASKTTIILKPLERVFENNYIVHESPKRNLGEFGTLVDDIFVFEDSFQRFIVVFEDSIPGWRYFWDSCAMCG
jgi:hypothetical protein